MNRNRLLGQAALLVLILILTTVVTAAPQVAGKADQPAPPKARLLAQPRLEAVGDIRDLMLGINVPNFLAMNQELNQQPVTADVWPYVRLQAVLVAENGYLLLLRPPRRGAGETWADRATALRTAATGLARVAANKDYARSRSGLIDVARACNRCHESFGVAVRVNAFAERAFDNYSASPAVPAAPSPPRVPAPPAPPKPPSPPGDRP
jgi:cytochrome c553